MPNQQALALRSDQESLLLLRRDIRDGASSSMRERLLSRSGAPAISQEGNKSDDTVHYDLSVTQLVSPLWRVGIAQSLLELIHGWT